MKKLLLSILIFSILSSCSNKFIKQADKQPENNSKNYGLVIFSVTYLRNPFLRDRIFANLEGLQGGKELLKINPGSNKIFAFWVKKGTYFLGNFITESSSKELTEDPKGKDSVLISFPIRYQINVKANTATYFGNIFIQSVGNHRNYNTTLNVQGETVKLSAQINVRIQKSDIEKAKSQFESIQNLKNSIEIAKMQISDSKNNTHISNILNHSNTEQGYKNIKWNSSISQVKERLEKDNKRVLVMSSTQLIDHTAQATPVEFFFSDKKGLLKVVEHLNSFKLKEIIQKLNSDFGKSVNGKNQSWITPYSMIRLEKTKSDIILTYTPLTSSSKAK